MKGRFLFYLFIVVLISVSCRKERTCKCVVRNGVDFPKRIGAAYFVETTEEMTYKEIKKAKAKDLCLSTYQKTDISDTMYRYVSRECTLK